ncbi:hypothetical protein CFBP7129_18230 [Agrobacterium tumefaciens]|uniref:Propionyl-coenzyme A carboxylase alpha polypeptide n=1 Tax=Agrobacterium tumefaciens TaxID=358 RepID=A0A4D7YRJ1_AGRTU|nr:hypothetical protein CFBP7129_18230 [Agrobacterium tumefaciens]
MPCRASPPQGGRSVVATARFLTSSALRATASIKMFEASRLSISPLEGEMSGRTEGGEPHPPT